MGLIVANFMDSSLRDLEKKGVFDTVAEIYNPGCAYECVVHFTAHAADRDMAERLRSHRIELVVHEVVGLQPLKMLRALMQAWRLFGEAKVDIVRGRLPYLGSLVGAIAARLRRLPFVVSLGGDNRIGQERANSYYLGYRWLSYGVETLVLRLSTRIIVTNKFTADYVARIIGPTAARRKCAIVPWISPPVPAHDPHDAVRLADFNFPSDAFIIPVIGFINPYKFSDVLFDALAERPLRTPDGRVVIVCFAGDGPLRGEGERRFEGRSDVVFLGWQQREVIHALLRRADLVLIPMSGFVLLEAASLGKIVITSSVEWHSEVVRDRETGYLIDPHRPENWQKAILRALSELPSGRQMGVRLQELYQQALSPEAAVAAEHALYELLTSKQIAS